MTGHLFKLKKDGKTVGYLELLVRTPYGYPVLWFRNLDRLDDGREWHSGNNVQADSIHPFVTKDKNGKDVFEGDKATAIVWMEDLANHRIVGEIIYYNCGYCIQTLNTYYHLSDLKDIELIEAKDNDNDNN